MRTSKMLVKVQGQTRDVPIRWGSDRSGIAVLKGEKLGNGVVPDEVVPLEDWIVVTKRQDHFRQGKGDELDEVRFLVR